MLLSLLCVGGIQAADDNGNPLEVPITNDCKHKKTVMLEDKCDCPMQYRPLQVGLKFTTKDEDRLNSIPRERNQAQIAARAPYLIGRDVTDTLRIIGFKSDRGNIIKPETSVSFHRSKYVQLFNMIRGMPNAQRVISLTKCAR